MSSNIQQGLDLASGLFSYRKGRMRLSLATRTNGRLFVQRKLCHILVDSVNFSLLTIRDDRRRPAHTTGTAVTTTLCIMTKINAKVFFFRQSRGVQPNHEQVATTNRMICTREEGIQSSSVATFNVPHLY